MPRKLTTRAVKIGVACNTLSCSERTFERKWQRVLTDARSPEDRRPRCVRKFYEDELSVALEEGTAAVLTFRKQMGRLES